MQCWQGGIQLWTRQALAGVMQCRLGERNVTKDSLRQLYDKPINDAAAVLGIGVTVRVGGRGAMSAAVYGHISLMRTHLHQACGHLPPPAHPLFPLPRFRS